MNAETTNNIHVSTRGIGKDMNIPCFCCKRKVHKINATQYTDNLTLFVDTEHDGRLLMSWVNDFAQISFRQGAPNWVRVKLGACKNHLHKLVALDNKCKGGTLCQSYIEGLCLDV